MKIISSIEKVERRFYADKIPKNIKFEDAERLLKYHGCKLTNKSGGSHYAVTHPSIDRTIIIARHNTALKRYNINDIKAFIDDITTN